MAVKTEKELSEDQRAHWLKAVAAIELRNFGYAISLLQGILKQEPQFLTGRQLLRRTEVTRFKAAKKKFFNVSTASMAVMKAQREMKKDAKRAVELIDKILEDEPPGQQIAETYALHEAEPQNVDAARRLGALSEQKEDLDAAIAWYRYASDLTHGSDPGLLRKISDLTVKQTEREIVALEDSVASNAGDTMVLAEKNAALGAAKN